MFVLFILLSVLVGCGGDHIRPEQAVLKKEAEKAIQKQSYETAANRLFELWCYYPLENEHALLSAAEYFAQAGKFDQALELADDYLLMKGNHDGKAYFVKALAYHDQVLTPLKDVDRAEKALTNLNEYRKYNPKNIEMVEKMEKLLKRMLSFSMLIDAELALKNNPPSYLIAMNKTQQIIEKYPELTDIVDYAKTLWNNAAANLNLLDDEKTNS